MTPTKTVTAYKLFRRMKGQLYPLFIHNRVPVPIGVWVPAEDFPTPGYADRPGWHTGLKPIAPHLMRRDGTMPANRVWAEVEIPADVDWQPEADKSPTRDLRGKVPAGGYYRFPRPKSQGGEWVIAGAIKVIRTL